LGLGGLAAELLTGSRVCAADITDAAPASSGALEEIVVTAQRRSERAQDVPLTVSAFSAEQLESSGIANIQDLKLVEPGLSVGNQVGFAFIHLRGVGSTAIGPGIENPVAIYVDGVYYASTSSSLFNFIDVQSVEVLKGPQGTLFGRNATGGLIQITTREPTQETRLDADVGVANYQTAKGDLYLAGGVTGNLAADVALQVTGMGEGYGRNFYNGKEVYRDDMDGAVRSKWVWTPLDATKLTATFDYSKQRNSDTTNVIAPGATNLPFLPLAPASSSPWDIDQNIQPLFDNENGGASVRLDQDAGFAKLMDIVAYRQSATSIHWDLDYSPEPFEAGLLHTDENQFSEEFQLASKPDEPVRWTGGLYYFHSGSEYDPSHVPFDPNPALSLIPGFSGLSVYSAQRARSMAGYGQATATILPNTDLTVGARYTAEKHWLDGTTLGYLIGGPSVDLGPPVVGESRSFDKLTYRVALDYHLTPDVMLYASYNTGFKSGGFNTQSLTDPAFLPEILDASEVGAKTEFLDHRLRVNLAGFYYKYHDIQVQKIELSNTGIINGASATIKGVDLDLEAAVTAGFSITGSAEYLNGIFNSFPDAPLSNPDIAVTAPVATGSAAGNQLPYAPHLVVTLAGNYNVNLGTNAIDLHVTANHSSSFAVEADNVIQQPEYTKLNAFMRWAPSSGQYGVTLWGKNLTNVASITYGGTLVDGIRQAHFEPPRTYGITFEYHMK
jgi:outer membrane receptor protein involved in Fe transport